MKAEITSLQSQAIGSNMTQNTTETVNSPDPYTYTNKSFVFFLTEDLSFLSDCAYNCLGEFSCCRVTSQVSCPYLGGNIVCF